jgi:hypothetical protein
VEGRLVILDYMEGRLVNKGKMRGDVSNYWRYGEQVRHLPFLLRDIDQHSLKISHISPFPKLIAEEAFKSLQNISPNVLIHT